MFLAVFNFGNVKGSALRPAVTQLGLLPGGSFTINGAGGLRVWFRSLTRTAPETSLLASAAGAHWALPGRRQPRWSAQQLCQRERDRGRHHRSGFLRNSIGRGDVRLHTSIAPAWESANRSTIERLWAGPIRLCLSDRFGPVRSDVRSDQRQRGRADNNCCEPRSLADPAVFRRSFHPSGVSLSHPILVLPNEVMNIEMVARANEYGFRAAERSR